MKLIEKRIEETYFFEHKNCKDEIKIIFTDNEFDRCSFNFSNTNSLYTRENWKTLVDIEKEITRIEELNKE
jgi:hypothetical protein